MSIRRCPPVLVSARGACARRSSPSNSVEAPARRLGPITPASTLTRRFRPSARRLPFP